MIKAFQTSARIGYYLLIFIFSCLICIQEYQMRLNTQGDSSNFNINAVSRHRGKPTQAKVGTKLLHIPNKTLSPPGILLHTAGGIGNQLFQYACSYGLSKQLNWPVYLFKPSPSIFDHRTFHQNVREFSLDRLSVPEINVIESGVSIDNKFYTSEFNVQRRMFPKNILNGRHFIELAGYYQSMEFWSDHSEDIRNLLRPSEDIRETFKFPATNVLQDIETSESVAVHVRRGDFLQARNFDFFIPITYQRIAIRKMVKILAGKGLTGAGPVFFVFSDDIQFVKESFADLELNWRFVYVSEFRTNSLQDFYLMIKCKHIILPNSTFSWWAGFLNAHSNKTVIASAFNPMWWGGETKEENHGKRYHPQDWIVIDIFAGEIV